MTQCFYRRRNGGFTLLEIIIVVILIGIIAAFAVPGYGRATSKARERNAILGLLAIHSANQIYEAQNSEVLQGAGLNLTAINTGFNIELKPTDLVYSYTSSAVDEYDATAQWPGATGFTVRVNETAVNLNGGNNPCCSAGACPTLNNC